jgi:hypothetical protein
LTISTGAKSEATKQLREAKEAKRDKQDHLEIAERCLADALSQTAGNGFQDAVVVQ